MLNLFERHGRVFSSPKNAAPGPTTSAPTRSNARSSATASSFPTPRPTSSPGSFARPASRSAPDAWTASSRSTACEKELYRYCPGSEPHIEARPTQRRTRPGHYRSADTCLVPTIAQDGQHHVGEGDGVGDSRGRQPDWRGDVHGHRRTDRALVRARQPGQPDRPVAGRSRPATVDGPRGAAADGEDFTRPRALKGRDEAARCDALVWSISASSRYLSTASRNSGLTTGCDALVWSISASSRYWHQCRGESSHALEALTSSERLLPPAWDQGTGTSCGSTAHYKDRLAQDPRRRLTSAHVTRIVHPPFLSFRPTPRPGFRGTDSRIRVFPKGK